MAQVLGFLIRNFSNYYTLHCSNLAARAAPLDPLCPSRIIQKTQNELNSKRDTVNQQKKSGQRKERKYLVKIRVLNKVNHTLNIRNQVCREQQIQQTKADVVKKRKIRKIQKKNQKKEHFKNIYLMSSINCKLYLHYIVSRNRSRKIHRDNSERIVSLPNYLFSCLLYLIVNKLV